MWNPFRAQRELQLATLAAMKEMSVAQSKALEAIALAVSSYLDSFKVEGKPQGWIMDDPTEARLERERIAANPDLYAPAPSSFELERLSFLAHELDHD